MTTSVSGGRATILAVSVTLLRALHDWSGVVAIAGVAVHLVLHARWIARMTRRVFWAPGDATTERGAAARPRAAATGAAVAAMRAAPGTPAGRPAASSADGVALERQRADRRRERDRRYTRKGFLQGAVAAGGVTMLLGTGLFELAGRSSAAPSTTSSGTSGSAGTTGGGTTSVGTTTVSSPVVIASNSCISCGRCLQACPHGVLAWGSDGRASVQNPSSCTRCGRCVSVCPVAAITLSA
jgi:NAD-dependent dihydropyrimidine dehydrogenase PreA subunit